MAERAVLVHGIYHVDGLQKVMRVNPNGSLDVVLNDQTTNVVFQKFIIEEGTFDLKVDTVAGEYTFESLNTHGITVGDIIEIYNGSNWIQAQALVITVDTPVAGTDTIALDQPFDMVYAVATTTCYRGTDNLNVNGSVTPVVARMTNKDLDDEWDITQIDMYLQDSLQMDGALFGAMPALTRGILLRARLNDFYKNGFIAKTNGDLIMVADRFAYDDRAPSGSYSLNLKKYIGGQQHLGVVLRLGNQDGREPYLEILIQDDLTGLEAFYVRAEGSLVLP